ncbi:MAG: hypothetical protein ACE5NC_06085 [Anaerolineae bacterium]
MAILARLAQAIPVDFLVVGIVASSGLASILGRRRVAVLLLLLQYLGLILLLHGRPSLLAAKAVVGLLVALILVPRARDPLPTHGMGARVAMSPAFRILGLAAVGTAVAGLLYRYPLLQLPPAEAWITYGLAGSGLWLVLVSRDPMLLVVGLLTALNGFDVLHTTLEPGLLVAALSGVGQILLALAGAYLAAARTARAGEEAR